MRISKPYLLSGLMMLAAPVASADDHADLNAIYRVFFDAPVTAAGIAQHYAENVIHVGRNDTPLVVGKDAFMAVNIDPFVDMLDTEQVSWTGTTYVVRRVIEGDMANDVGYLYSRIALPDGREMEQVQKYSWVFLKEDGTWRVLTDFDATMAPLSVLDELEPQFTISGSNNRGEPAE